MPGLLIIAHAPLATSLKAVATHAFPECGGTLEVLDVSADMPIDEIEARARELLSRVRDPEAVILTDVFGATPCNVAQRLASTVGEQVALIAGVNVPMLWRSLCYRRDSLDSLVARAVAGATQGVIRVTTAVPQHEAACLPGANDQDHCHDKQ